MSSAYGVYVSQLVPYAIACFACGQVLDRGGLLEDDLVLREFRQSCVVSAFLGFYDLIFSCSLLLGDLGRMLSDVFSTKCWAVLWMLILAADCSVKEGVLTVGVAGR